MERNTNYLKMYFYTTEPLVYTNHTYYFTSNPGSRLVSLARGNWTSLPFASLRVWGWGPQFFKIIYHK